MSSKETSEHDGAANRRKQRPLSPLVDPVVEPVENPSEKIVFKISEKVIV
jgi:hypothetical protein